MTSCCVVGCRNRYSPSSSIKFYRIPCGSRPLQVNRRRLWIKAIKQANGKDYDFSGHARICGAHFISGELSLDNESPDFVPSVFPNSIQRQNQNGLRRGRSRGLREKDELEEKPFSPEAPEAKPPVDPNPPVLMEIEISGETPCLSPSKPKEEALTKEVVPEIENMEMQETSIINKTLPEQPKGILPVIEMYPVVTLKPLIMQNGAFRCDLCNETFASASQLVKHRRQHEEPKSSDSSEAGLTEPHPVPNQEPSFPCNMCDQFFTTSRNLKRHKLLHVKDCRKCLRCGTMFCRRHNHFLFWPRSELKTLVQKDSLSAEADSLDHSPKKMEPDQSSEMAETVSFTDKHAVVVSELTPKMSKTAETQPPTSLSNEPSVLASEQVLKMSETAETQPPVPSTDEPSVLVPEQVPKMSETAETQPPVPSTDEPSVIVPEQVPKVSETAETQPPVPSTDEPSVLVPEQVLKMSETAETQPPVPSTDEPSVLVPEQVLKMSETAETQPPVPSTDKSLVSDPELVLTTSCKLPEIIKPSLVSVQPPPAPCPPPLVSTFQTNRDSSTECTSMPNDTPDLGLYGLPHHQELPSALKVFSPQYLTSALLDVERNYEYILNRAKTVQVENVVEEEPEDPDEPVFICPVVTPVKPAKGEKIAYDLEIIL
ncbi:protein SON [Nothobranchius furzeri]|uniref:Transcription factor HIVEP3-like n=1 Tax=Nothobranchius furzeri TaxID=105023 RepID=A0A9D2XY26_NOTFU|nr:transcription factor HIVEP3 [Nothobranchius furzeri]KAF7209314.1 transcription factor HIVEP3-like [Nothobranchius furzeri]